MINSRGCVFTTAIEPLDRCNVTSACKFSMVLRVVCVVGYLFFLFLEGEESLLSRFLIAAGKTRFFGGE